MVQLVYKKKVYQSDGKNNHSEKKLLKELHGQKKVPDNVEFEIDAFPCDDCQKMINNSDINHFSITVTAADYIDEWITRFPEVHRNGWNKLVKTPGAMPSSSYFVIDIRGPKNNRSTVVTYVNNKNQTSKRFVMLPYTD